MTGLSISLSLHERAGQLTNHLSIIVDFDKKKNKTVIMSVKETISVKKEPQLPDTTCPVAVKTEPHEPISSDEDENVMEEVEKILAEPPEKPIRTGNDPGIYEKLKKRTWDKSTYRSDNRQRLKKARMYIKKQHESLELGRPITEEMNEKYRWALDIIKFYTQMDEVHQKIEQRGRPQKKTDTPNSKIPRLDPRLEKQQHHDSYGIASRDQRNTKGEYIERRNIPSTSACATSESEVVSANDTVYLENFPLNEVLSHELKVSIVDKGLYGWRIHPENYLKVESVLLDDIFHLSIRNPSAQGPKFTSNERLRGFRVVTCDTIISVEFLKESVRRMGEIWPDARLEVIPLRELPSLPKVFITMPCGDRELKEYFGKKIIHVINVQNPDVNTTNWDVLYVGQPWHFKVFVVLCIDEESLRAIEKRGSCLTIGIREIRVKTSLGGVVGDEPELILREEEEHMKS